MPVAASASSAPSNAGSATKSRIPCLDTASATVGCWNSSHACLADSCSANLTNIPTSRRADSGAGLPTAMDEHLYLVTYDIRDDKRWRRVFKTMKGFGEWLQLSVFQCRLSRRRHAEM